MKNQIFVVTGFDFEDKSDYVREYMDINEALELWRKLEYCQLPDEAVVEFRLNEKGPSIDYSEQHECWLLLSQIETDDDGGYTDSELSTMGADEDCNPY